MPQLAQNLAAPGSSVPHSVQCFTAGAIAWPQPMQNFAPAGFDVEQLAQATPVGAGAGAAAAAGAGAGAGAGGGACCCWSPAAEAAAESEAGGQERALGRAAALGHALAGAERHLARRVLPEPARQLGVRGVLGQLLELGRVLGRRG